MKRSIILLTFVFAASVIFAQKGKVTSAQNLKDSGKIKEALEAINTAIDASNSKSKSSIDWPKTWETRGEIYQEIFRSKDASVKALSKDPLTEALNSYKKAINLDAGNKFGKSIKIKLTLLINDLQNQAVDCYNKEDYSGALSSFEQNLEINEMPLIKADNPNAIDTTIIFNAGLAAYSAKNYDKAIKFYSEAVKHKYGGARTISYMANAYQLKGDTAMALEVLKRGFEEYPNDATVLASMIQIYLDTNKSEEALKYLELAIKQDPKNSTFHFAEGALHEKMENEDEAIECYKKSIEFDPKFFNGFYNLGVLYYNKGVKQQEVAFKVPANENAKYLAEMKKADEWFEKSMPYMEKCAELQPNDKSSLESLKNLYYRLISKDKATWEPKYNSIIEKIKNL